MKMPTESIRVFVNERPRVCVRSSAVVRHAVICVRVRIDRYFAVISFRLVSISSMQFRVEHADLLDRHVIDVFCCELGEELRKEPLR